MLLTSPEQGFEDLIGAFVLEAHPANAEAMSRYMRGQFPFFGIKTPGRRALVKAQVGKAVDWSTLERFVQLCYEAPQRELHYAALDVLLASHKAWEPEVVDLLERLALTHSWWDTVDPIAAPLVWKAFTLFPERAGQADVWIAHQDFWLQRVALLFQRCVGAATNREQLARYIRKTMDSREFFLCKAIGWALRQYGYVDPEWVRDFVANPLHGALSPLSRREATRALKARLDGSRSGDA